MKKYSWYSLPAAPTLGIVAAAVILLVLVFTREAGTFLT